MRKFVMAAAAVASMYAVVGIAPSALASNESAEVSSLGSGVPVSGTSSSTLTGSSQIYAQIFLPTSLFASQLFDYYRSDAALCEASYGITLSVDGVPELISFCESDAMAAAGSMPAGTNLFVNASSTRYVPAGSVITLTWGSTYTTSVASLSGATVWVFDADAQANVPVVLSSLSAGSSSSNTSTPILMWQQAYGRASATDSCQAGYTPSWDTWPNGGTGGFVCNRFVPEYGN